MPASWLRSQLLVFSSQRFSKRRPFHDVDPCAAPLGGRAADDCDVVTSTSFADRAWDFQNVPCAHASITFPPSTELPCSEIQKMTAPRPSTAPRSWRQRFESEQSSQKVYWILHFESAVSAHDRGAQGRDRVAALFPNGVWRPPLFHTGKPALNNAVRLRGHVGMRAKQDCSISAFCRRASGRQSDGGAPTN